MSKKVTIYDIAKALNTSAATVSRALNNNPKISEKTRKLVLETAERMNYKQNKLALALKSGKSKNVGVKTKVSIAAALGYFILPTVAIFVFTPLIGYSDDLGVLLFALTQISSSITPEIKEKARQKLKDWFGEIDENELEDLESKIG